MFKQTQRSFAGGQLDRELMGRTDLAKYYTGASRIENLLVRRQGNLAKRRGTVESADLSGLLGQDGAGGADIPFRSPRLFPIVSTVDGGCHLLVTGRRAFLCSRKGLRAVTYRWLRSIGPYDGTVPYASRSSTGQEYAYMIGADGYDTLAEAMAAAQDGDTIVVGRDDTFTSGVSFVTDGTVTLDLNGHTLSSTLDDATAHVAAFSAAAANTTLVIEDSAGGGMITQPEPVCAHLVGATAAGAKLVVNNGRVIARGRTSTAATGSPVKWRSAVWISPGGRFEGNGGVVANEGNEPVWDAEYELYTCKGNPIFYLGTGSHASGTISISGGFYRGAYNFGLTPPYGADCSQNAILLATKDAGSASTATVSISGGLVAVSSAGGSMDADGYCNKDIELSEKIRVTGGALLGWGHEDWAMSNVRSESTNGNTQGYEDSIATGSVPNSTLRAVWIPTVEPGLGLYQYVNGCHPTGEPDYLADWTCSDDHWATPASPAPSPALLDLRPYYVDVPWDDSELAELNFCQSGDTLFFAHRNHPPARIAFNPASVTLEYSLVPFSSPWLPPVIPSIGMSDINKTTSSVSTGSSKSSRSTTTTTYDLDAGTKTISVIGGASGDTATTTTTHLPKRTVSYRVSYVKDGVESPPSAARSATYLAPWAEGEKINVRFNKGGNASQPDEYRIYKKEGTDFGLIGVVRNLASIVPDPNVSLQDPFSAVPRGSFRAYGEADATQFTVPEAEETKGRTLSGCCESWSMAFEGASGPFTVWPGLGAVLTPKAVYSFGRASGVSVATVEVSVDAHRLRYEEQDDGTVKVYDDVTLSGKTINVSMTRRTSANGSASTLSASKTLPAFTYTPEGGSPVSAFDGTVTHYLGRFPADVGYASIAEAARSASVAPRTARFSFDIGTDQTNEVSLSATDGSGRTCDLVLAGVAFRQRESIASSFDDDYITPDMSLTPIDPESPYQGSGNYPACVWIHQQRLVFASTRNAPSEIRLSATGDLYTFSAHSSIREDDTIAFSLAATEFPDINHMVSSRDLVVLCDGGEWKVAPVSGNTITYKTISATLQSSIGSAKWIKPITVGNEIVFADRTGMSLRAVAYNFASDGYESQDLTVLSGNIFAGNRIVRMCYKQHPDSTLVCALSDGTIATLVYMREHEVVAWSHHTLGGGWLVRDVSTSKSLNRGTTEVALVVERDGRLKLWSVRPDDPSPTVAAQVCLDGCRTMTGAEAAAEGAWIEGWEAVDLLTGEVYPSKSALQAAESYGSRSYAVGFPIRSELVTVRPEPSPDETIQFDIKNLKSVEARTICAGRYEVRSFAAAASVRPTAAKAHVPVSDGTVGFATSDVATTVMGANTGDGRVQIVQEDVWPMQILQLSANYEMQPLSGSEG